MKILHVKEGASLYDIADQIGISVEELFLYNQHIENPNFIVEGVVYVTDEVAYTLGVFNHDQLGQDGTQHPYLDHSGPPIPVFSSRWLKGHYHNYPYNHFRRYW